MFIFFLREVIVSSLSSQRVYARSINRRSRGLDENKE